MRSPSGRLTTYLHELLSWASCRCPACAPGRGGVVLRSVTERSDAGIACVVPVGERVHESVDEGGADAAPRVGEHKPEPEPVTSSRSSTG